MKRQYQVIALDKENVPVRIATITENSKPKAKAVGQRIAKMIGKRFMWGAIYALLAIKTVTLAAIGMAVAGVGLFGLEYYRSRKAGKEVITEVNFAGQTVEGSRASLCRNSPCRRCIAEIGV